jgi:hypothetical protein
MVGHGFGGEEMRMQESIREFSETQQREERENEIAHIRRLEARVAELEAHEIRPHELRALYELVAYARAIAKAFPDKEGDQFAAKLLSYASAIEDVVQRIETAKAPPARPEPSEPFAKG